MAPGGLLGAIGITLGAWVGCLPERPDALGLTPRAGLGATAARAGARTAPLPVAGVLVLLAGGRLAPLTATPGPPADVSR